MATENELTQEMEQLRATLQSLNTESQKSTGFFKSLGEEVLGTKKSFAQSKAEFGKALGGGINDVTTNLVSFATTVGSGNTKFSAMNGVVDSVTNALSSMLSAVPLVGTALGAVAKTTGELGKFVLNQMDVVTDAFEDLGKTGALTAKGMSGLTDQFLASKMTMDGYKKAVTENAGALARFGGIAGEGAERFSKAVGDIISSNAGDELRRLGYSADSIGQTAGAFLKQQSILGKANQLTQDQLRAGSVAYARELDQLAKLTGANREELQKKQQDALRESRFLAAQTKLRDQNKNKEADAILNYTTIVGDAAPRFAKGLRDLSTGFADTAEASMVITATNGEAQHIQDMLNEGKIDEIKAVALLQESLTRNRSAVIEQAASTEDNINSFGRLEETLGIMGLQFDNEGKVRQTLNQTTEKQIKGQDGMTEQVIQAKKALEAFSRDMFQIAVSLMPQAATAIHMLTNTIRDFITEIQYFIKNGKFRSEEGGSTGRKALQLAGGAIGAAAGVFGTGVLAGATGGAGVLASSALIGGGAALGVGAGNALADVFGFGKGGLETEFGGGGSQRPEDLLAFTGGSGDREHFDKLDQGIRDRVLAAAAQYNQVTGKKLIINSAFRSPEEQMRAAQQAKAAGRPAADPGQSLHQSGQAVDIQNYNDPAALQALNAVGLRQSVANDLPHFSAAYGGIMSGPKSGYQGMLHGDEAVIPLAGGRSISVEQPALTGSLQEQIGLLANNNNLLSELISLMSNNNSISSKILQVARG